MDSSPLYSSNAAHLMQAGGPEEHTACGDEVARGLGRDCYALDNPSVNEALLS